MQIRLLRRIRQEFAEHLQGLGMASQPDTGVGVDRPKGAIFGVDTEELPGLLERPGVFVALR